MLNRLTTASLAALVCLTFVPAASAEHDYSYHRTEHYAGTATGTLCFTVTDLVAVPLVHCLDDVTVTWEFESFAEIACGSDEFVYGNTLTVQGLVHGTGAAWVGTWYVGPATYVGSYGVDVPFVYTGSILSNDMGLSLWGDNPTSGHMDFSGTGSGSVTAETVQEHCPESEAIGLPPLADCGKSELGWGTLVADLVAAADCVLGPSDSE